MSNSNKSWLKFWFILIILSLLFEFVIVYSYVVKLIEVRTFILIGLSNVLTMVVALKNIRHFKNKIDMK